MRHEFDLVIIGSGTAAMVAATRARAAEWKVAVVDFRPLGGTCALRGCDPKKVLIGGAAAFDHARRMQGLGVAGTLQLDWPALMRFKRGFTDPVPAQREQRLRDIGATVFHGAARFTGPNTLSVKAGELAARHVLIAAGAEPARLHIPGEEHLLDNEEFLGLHQLPRRIVLIGGGYIAAEFRTLPRAPGRRSPFCSTVSGC